jgi:hypothetical protein
MKLWITTLGAVLLVAGCGDSTPSKPMTGGDTKMSSMTMMSEGCPDKDATHIVTEDTPIFTTMPSGQGASPVAMIKAGTKVLAMVPGPMYTKCVMGGGKSVYIKTASLKPTTN